MPRPAALLSACAALMFCANASAHAPAKPDAAKKGAASQPISEQVLRHVFVGSFVAAGKLLHCPVLAAVYADKLLLKPGDLVRFKIDKKKPPAVNDLFASYVLGATLSHPHSHDRLGRTAKVTGVLQVEQVVGDQAEARIRQAVSEVEPGQLVQPLLAPLWRDVSQHEADPKVAGYVVGLEHGALLGAQQRLAYIDRGSDDGMQIGDDLTVFVAPKVSGSARRQDVAGRAVVVALQVHTATCMLVDTLWEIGPGATFAATHANTQR